MGGTPGQKLSKLRDQSASSSVVSHAAGNLFCGLCADKGGLAQGPSSSAIKSRVFAASTPAESVKACRTLAARISIPPSVCCCSCSAAADATYTGPFQQVIVRRVVEMCSANSLCAGERSRTSSMRRLLDCLARRVQSLLLITGPPRFQHAGHCMWQLHIGDQQVHCPARAAQALSCLLHGRAPQIRERVASGEARHIIAPGDPGVLLAQLCRTA